MTSTIQEEERKRGPWTRAKIERVVKKVLCLAGCSIADDHEARFKAGKT